MADNILITLGITAVLGFLSGLGIGGGSLLLLWLTLFIGEDPSEARLINLLFFLPAAAVSCWFRGKQGVLKIRPILPAAICGCIGAMLGCILSENLPVYTLRKLFGMLLMVTGIRELRYKQKNKAS